MVIKRKGVKVLCLFMLLLSLTPTCLDSTVSEHFDAVPCGALCEDAGAVSPSNCNITPYKGGGFRLNVSGEECIFESSFSFPNTGYNKLLCKNEVDKTGEAGWSVNMVVLNSSMIEVTCYGKYYHLKRFIIRDEYKIIVRDTFTNLREEDVGIFLSNKVTAEGTVKTLYVCGTAYPVSESITLEEPRFGLPSDNPTLFIGKENTGVGLVAEDDVYRVHLGVQYENGGGSLYTRHFGLGINSSYMMEWSIYPVSPPDYWTFINSVRRSWKVNFKIEGPLQFMSADFLANTPLEELRRVEAQRRWRLITVSPWFDYGEAYAMTREEFAELVKPAIAKAKRVNPHVTTLIMLEPPLKEISPDQLPEYLDSIPILPTGEPSVDKQYQDEVPPSRRAKGYKLYDVYPAVGNKRFRELMDYIDFAMDVCGYNGVYLDSFMGHCYGVYNTYDKWDGYSVDMDPNVFTVVRKYASLRLVTSEALKRLIEHVHSKGGVVVTNTRPSIRSIESLHMYTFYEKNEHSEGPHVKEATAATHLYTPICLGDIQIRNSLKDFMDDVRLQLRHGTLYYPYNVVLPGGQENYGVLNHMFPFTPVEIGGGYLKGEERIITLKNGVYGWDDNSTIKYHLFDADGREIPARFFQVKSIGGKTFVNVTLKEGQIAILERGEAELSLQPPTASFTYSPENPNDLAPIKFIDKSKAVEGDVTCWYWDFGDGTYSSEKDPSHTYSWGGEYTVTLWVGDENGMISSAYSLKVQVASYRIPVTVMLISLTGASIYLIARRWRSIVKKWRGLMKYPIPRNI